MPSRLATSSRRFVCQQCRQASAPVKRRRFFTSSTRLQQQPEIYDVVTVGGGPAGLALLAALKSSPVTSHLKTALIETQDLSKIHGWNMPDDRYSNRASSLTPTSVASLEKSGAWSHVDQTRVQPYDEMQVWDASNDGAIHFDWKHESRQYNAPAQTIATMTENLNLTRGLLKRISELGGDSSLFSNTSVSQIKNGDNDVNGSDLSAWPVLSLEAKNANSPVKPPTSIAARLLVGADGFNSPVRAFTGINSKGWDYDRHGVVATLKVQPMENADEYQSDMFTDESSMSNRATAFQRFIPSLGGPIAILPLPNNHASLVWSTTPAHASYLKSLDPASQLAMVNAALRLSAVDLKYLFTLPATSPHADESAHESELRWRLQHTPAPSLSRQPPIVQSIQSGTLASFPLRFRQSSSLINPRVALIGDAAHTIHPLAGQGLNLGLADADALATTIAFSVEHGMDLGDLMSLERYSSERFGKGLLMGGGVDFLNHLYQFGAGGDGPVSGLLGKARGWGMDLVDSVPGLKGLIMKQAG
ncbi:ubiquinone biosynthesis monooxygenase COQ6 [Exophiala mesophila]|uniref:Ubiquinone biosynthesis monooxygenase COQ6, mitochondrial n=1 Tax=Exophiala mesophila TaxID=212818 RepID=A0A0D2A9C5_EXOME|nr:ubiquinone biosynthesis monooxygenase COQ6 [Exophiala mesophila]KIV95543.1 ubiquinone biosynthesis monooxygenase COQ6 [Exophiala mesophila]